MVYSLNEMLKESAGILRGYYDGFLQPFKQSPEYFQEVLSLVEMLENQRIGPKQLIEELEELTKTDLSIQSYNMSIRSAWDRRIQERDWMQRCPLMRVDATNHQECAGLLEILSFAQLTTQFKVLVHNDRYGQVLFQIHEDHPQLIAGLLERMEQFPCSYKAEILNTYGPLHRSTIFTRALKGYGHHLPAFIEMINRFKNDSSVDKLFCPWIDSNPLKVALDFDPAYVPAILKMISRISSQHCFQLLSNGGYSSDGGVSAFKRILDLESPEAIAELIPILKNKLDSETKAALFTTGATYVLPNLKNYPDWLLTAMMTFFAEDDSLPEYLLLNLINSLSIFQINNNLMSFLLIFSRLSPTAQQHVLSVIINEKSDDKNELIDILNHCPDLESLNTLLVRSAAIKNSPNSLLFLFTLISTGFPERLTGFLLASNDTGDTALIIAARDNHPALKQLLHAIEGYDPKMRYQILSKCNHMGKSVLTVAKKSNYEEVENLEKLINETSDVLIACYNPNLNLFKPEPGQTPSCSTETELKLEAMTVGTS